MLSVNFFSASEFQSYIKHLKKEEDKFKRLSLDQYTTSMLRVQVSLSHCHLALFKTNTVFEWLILKKKVTVYD